MDWIRHRLGLKCKRPVIWHNFEPTTWTRPWPEPHMCGYIPYSLGHRCGLPERCHYPWNRNRVEVVMPDDS